MKQLIPNNFKLFKTVANFQIQKHILRLLFLLFIKENLYIIRLQSLKKMRSIIAII